jgi:uncharacterized protein
MRKRYLFESIEELAFRSGKMAFVSGPRQVGKTTMGKMALKERGSGAYCNWDDVEFRRKWAKDPKMVVPATDGNRLMLVLDEIHKAKSWKRSVKGLYDTLDDPLDILVTGSARLNVFKKGGDSLLGRYYHFRMHPFSMAEMNGLPPASPEKLRENIRARALSTHKASLGRFEALFRFGGFPEPLFAQDDRRARLWRQGRVEKVIREDLRDLSRIPELGRIEMLAALLPEKVGSLFSVASLREDLEVSYDTVKRWLIYLKELYYLFEIKPYRKSINRSLKKEGKIYLWDSAEVREEPSRFENLVASHLLKACDFWTDTGEGLFELHFLRDKEKNEIDFLITRDKSPWLPIEAKWRDGEPSPAWRKFLPNLNVPFGVQLVSAPGHWKWSTVEGKEVLTGSAEELLAYLV